MGVFSEPTEVYMSRNPTGGTRRRKRVVHKPKEEDHVEMEKIDAESFLKQGAESQRPQIPEDSKLRDPDAELMAHAVPVGPAMMKQPDKPKAEDMPEIKPPPPKEPEDPLDRILPDSVVNNLTAKFGVLGDSEALTEDIILAGGKEVRVSFRKPHYDDFLWALGEIETRIKTGQDLSLLRGDQARQSFLNHLGACCTVVKIEGEYVWDVFNAVKPILDMHPKWDKTLGDVPYLLRNDIVNNTYELLRMLHPDLLFALRGSVLDAFPDSGGAEDETEDKEPEEDEDPSEAA